ncbi:MAG: hypothetical protein QM589_18515 [Thermomicrobiales bacterium]
MVPFPAGHDPAEAQRRTHRVLIYRSIGLGLGAVMFMLGFSGAIFTDVATDYQSDLIWKAMLLGIAILVATLVDAWLGLAADVAELVVCSLLLVSVANPNAIAAVPGTLFAALALITLIANVVVLVDAKPGWKEYGRFLWLRLALLLAALSATRAEMGVWAMLVVLIAYWRPDVAGGISVVMALVGGLILLWAASHGGAGADQTLTFCLPLVSLWCFRQAHLARTANGHNH